MDEDPRGADGQLHGDLSVGVGPPFPSGIDHHPGMGVFHDVVEFHPHPRRAGEDARIQGRNVFRSPHDAAQGVVELDQRIVQPDGAEHVQLPAVEGVVEGLQGR